jgi:hypothetical protein
MRRCPLFLGLKEHTPPASTKKPPSIIHDPEPLTHHRHTGHTPYKTKSCSTSSLEHIATDQRHKLQFQNAEKKQTLPPGNTCPGEVLKTPFSTPIIWSPGPSPCFHGTLPTALPVAPWPLPLAFMDKLVGPNFGYATRSLLHFWTRLPNHTTSAKLKLITTGGLRKPGRSKLT